MSEDEYIRIVDKYIGDVKRVAVFSCKNEFDAEDITQIVFMKLLKCKQNFESDEHIKHWLLRVTINECNSFWKTPWKQKVDFFVPQSAFANTPKSQEESKVLKAIGSLKKQYRQIIILFYYEDYSAKEIAKILDISESAAFKRLQRARDDIRDYMLKESGD